MLGLAGAFLQELCGCLALTDRAKTLCEKLGAQTTVAMCTLQYYPHRTMWVLWKGGSVVSIEYVKHRETCLPDNLVSACVLHITSVKENPSARMTDMSTRNYHLPRCSPQLMIWHCYAPQEQI